MKNLTAGERNSGGDGLADGLPVKLSGSPPRLAEEGAWLKYSPGGEAARR